MVDRSHTHGEVFTPRWLVDEMLDTLPTEWFHTPDIVYYDPSCGDGAILAPIFLRLVNSVSPTDALRSIYGTDIVSNNVDECRNRLLKLAGDTPEHRKIVEHNIVCANSLTEWDFEKWAPNIQTQILNYDDSQ